MRQDKERQVRASRIWDIRAMIKFVRPIRTRNRLIRALAKDDSISVCKQVQSQSQSQLPRLVLDPIAKSIRVDFNYNENNSCLRRNRDITISLSPCMYAKALGGFLESQVVLKLIAAVFDGYTADSGYYGRLDNKAHKALGQLQQMTGDIERSENEKN